VRFDTKLIEAKLALGTIDSKDMPKVAWDALEAGLDGPSVRRMAAMNEPSGWESDQVLPQFMAETGLKVVSRRVASIRVGRELTLRILNEGLDPLAYLKDFEVLCVQADYAKVLWNAGSLDDQWAIEGYSEGSKNEVRKDALRVLDVLAKMGDEDV